MKKFLVLAGLLVLTALLIAPITIVPSGGGGAPGPPGPGITTNGNQFGESVELTIKDGALQTNGLFWNSLTVTGAPARLSVVSNLVVGQHGGTEMFFYPSNGAFRAGDGGGVWNSSLGNDSFGTGQLTLASNALDFAAGYGTIAMGSRSAAFCSLTIASGGSSFSCGQNSISSGNASFSCGADGVASGMFSFVANDFNVAPGISASAFGFGTRAQGENSFTAGNNTTASGQDNINLGTANRTSNNFAHAYGVNVTNLVANTIAFGSNVSQLRLDGTLASFNGGMNVGIAGNVSVTNGLGVVGGGITNAGNSYNAGSMTNGTGFTNGGLVRVLGNTFTSGITNNGDYTNSGNIYNNGTLTNGGAANIVGGVTNWGAMQTKGTADFAGSVTNEGSVNTTGGNTNWTGFQVVGTANFRSNVVVSAGQGAASNAWVGGTYFQQIGTAFTNLNGAGTMSNLANMSITGNTLTNNGDTLFAEWGIKLQNTKENTNQFQFFYGATTMLDTGLQIASNCTVRATCTISRTGNASQHVEAHLEWGPGGGTPFAFTNANLEMAENNGIANILKAMGGARAVGAHTNNFFRVEWKPTPR